MTLIAKNTSPHSQQAGKILTNEPPWAITSSSNPKEIQERSPAIKSRNPVANIHREEDRNPILRGNHLVRNEREFFPNEQRMDLKRYYDDESILKATNWSPLKRIF